MREIIIGPEGSNIHNRALNDDLLQLRAQGVKVYRTRVLNSANRHQDRDFEYEFITTAKDIHLQLGSFSYTGQLQLALLLDHEFSVLARESSYLESLELLLFLETKDRAWHIAWTEHSNLRQKFLVSLAH